MGKRMDEINAKSRWEKCFYHDIDLHAKKGKYHQCHFGAETLGEISKYQHNIDPAECDECQNYHSMYIETPITVSDFNAEMPKYWGEAIEPVKIRLCEDKKTYFGIYLGQFPRYISYRYDEETQELSLGTVSNAAIYVPEKKKIYFGDESWWSRIEPDEDITDITDEAIRNQWYLKLMYAITGEDEEDETDY